VGEPDWSDACKLWFAAWDVEKVTKDFYKAFRRIFEEAEKCIEGIDGRQRLFTQKLFNRLLFIRFLRRRMALIS